MTFQKNQISSFASSPIVDHSVRIVYGYIVDMVGIDGPYDEESEDPVYYLPLVAKEDDNYHFEVTTSPLRFADPPDMLAMNYGTPSDLIGRRVKIEYTGNHWEAGVCTVVEGRRISTAQSILEVPSRGFRYAPPGSGV